MSINSDNNEREQRDEQTVLEDKVQHDKAIVDSMLLSNESRPVFDVRVSKNSINLNARNLDSLVDIMQAYINTGCKFAGLAIRNSRVNILLIKPVEVTVKESKPVDSVESLKTPKLDKSNKLGLNKLHIKIPTERVSILDACILMIGCKDDSGIRDSTIRLLETLAKHVGWYDDISCSDIARYINKAACETYRYRQHMWIESQFGYADSMYTNESEHDDILDALAQNTSEFKGRPNECFEECIAYDIKDELLALLHSLDKRSRSRLIGKCAPNSNMLLTDTQTVNAVNRNMNKIPTCKAIAYDCLPDDQYFAVMNS